MATQAVRYPEYPDNNQQTYGGYVSFIISPTEEVSQYPASSLGGVGTQHSDSQDWTQRNKKDTCDVASVITSRDPSIACDDELVRY